MRQQMIAGFATLLLAAGGAVSAQTPRLLRDIGAVPIGASPADIVDLGGIAYMQATRGDVGSELFASDGTPAGTRLVADIAPGATGSAPIRLTVIGGRLFFFAYDVSSGYELWTSDGTGPGTRRLSDFGSSSGWAQPASPIADLGGVALFLVFRSAGTTELYRSDGTVAGTRSVATVCQDCFASSTIAVLGPRIVFTGFEAATGYEPWVSDGSAAGTHRLADISPGSSSSLRPDGADTLKTIGGRVLFLADDGQSGGELWSTDGSAAGTTRVVDLFPGPGSGLDPGLTVFAGELGSKIYFEGQDGSGFALWSSDGTAAGTTRVRTLGTGEFSLLVGFRSDSGLLYFASFLTPPGGAIWRTDGTAAGTFELGIRPAGASFTNRGSAAVSGAMLIAGFTPAGVATLFRSDGSVSGTVPVIEFGAAGAGTITELVAVGSRVFLSAGSSVAGPDLWVSDGSAAGTRSTPIAAGHTMGSFPASPTPLGSDLCLLASSDAMSYGVWCTDGSDAGTRRVDPPCSRPTGCVSSLHSLGGALLISADGGNGMGFEPWVSDGTAGGTKPLGDLCPGECGSEARPLVEAAGATLLGTASTNGAAMWRSDGTPEGTWQIKALDFQFFQDRGATLGGFGFFGAGDMAQGIELWRSDGTAGGTFPVGDLFPGPDSSWPASITGFGNRLYFSAWDAISGNELWSSTGTGPGTARLLDLCSGSCSSQPIALTVVGDSLFFYASDGSSLNFYRSDGSATGTEVLARLSPSTAGPGLPKPVATLGFVFFVGEENGTLQLFRSDGTLAGTQPVRSLAVGPWTGMPPALLAAGGRVWFHADDGIHGGELWSSDGSSAGTAMVGDIWPGPPSSVAHIFPAWISATPGAVVFAADDGFTGAEPWVVDLPPGPRLLRSDRIRSLAPPSPALTAVLPLDPGRDRYLELIARGDVDPDNRVLRDRSRPLVFYALEGPGELQLARTNLGQIRFGY